METFDTNMEEWWVPRGNRTGHLDLEFISIPLDQRFPYFAPRIRG